MRKKLGYTLIAFTLMSTVFISGCGKSEMDANNTSNATQNAGSTADTASNTTGKEISEENAKKIALDHAKVAESDTTALFVQKEIDDGISVYNVEFYVQEKEYDYEIKAEDGTIISTDFDIEHDFKNTDTTATFAEADAKKLALEKVPGAVEKDMQIRLEQDDGRQVYEGKIIYEDIEYDFTIDAANGSLLEWDQESVFD